MPSQQRQVEPAVGQRTDPVTVQTPVVERPTPQITSTPAPLFD
jgi:hypothetical protein